MAKVSLIFHLTLYIAIFLCTVNCLPNYVRIGGFFHDGDNDQELAFQEAIKQVNNDRTLLPRSELLAQVEQISAEDSFFASKKVCNMLRMGISSIFGPQSKSVSSHVQSICDTMKIPHLEMRWDNPIKSEDYSVNLYPHPSALSKAYADIVDALGWKHYTIIYETNEGLFGTQELLSSHQQAEHPKTIRQLPDTDDYRPLLMQIRNTGETHILLDCSTEKIYEVLKQSQQVGMMNDQHSYFITSLDLQTIDLDEFKYSGVKITAFRLVDPDNELVKRSLPSGNNTVMKTETALIYDAVHLFANALHNLDRLYNVDIHPLWCDRQATWRHGYNLTNAMKAIEIEGLTNLIKFDNQGFRTDFVLDIIELNSNGIDKVGDWNSTLGINITREQQLEVANLEEKTLIVTAILSNPYVMLQESSDKLTGYEGYAVDLMNEISKIIDMEYKLELVPDHRYGMLNNDTFKWDGMIGELVEQRADLAIGDITITSERETAVDFSMPYMNLGIAILYHKPYAAPPSMLSFLRPLSMVVWAYIALAYLGVSVLLFILAHFVEGSSSQDADKPESQFTLLNCFWFNIGSLMRQGCEFFPKATSTRMVAGLWWCFVLIMIALYTSNLAAFVTINNVVTDIKSVEDLVREDNPIRFGALQGGSTAQFFRESSHPVYKQIWSSMASRPEDFSSTTSQGVDRVLNGDYAFLMESSAIEYVTERYCNLTQIGDVLNSKNQGIAMKINSPYKKLINGAILKLQEDGVLTTLKTKWWKMKRGGGVCTPAETEVDVFELGYENITGSIFFLIIGLLIACIVGAGEVAWKAFGKDAKKDLDTQIPQ